MLVTRSDHPVPVAALYTVEKIAAGVELTFSYGASPATNTSTTPHPQGVRRCFCGEDCCTGYLPYDMALASA